MDNDTPLHLKLGLAKIPVGEKMRPMKAYQAVRIQEDRLPGVLLIHGVLGLDDHIRDITHRFAQANYFVLTPQLYPVNKRLPASGLVNILKNFINLVKRNLDDRIVSDLHDAVEYLAGHDDVDSQRIAVVGIGFGGSYALELACNHPDVKAAAVFYSPIPHRLDDFSQACPIIGSYPQNDFTISDSRKLETALEENKDLYDIKVYPGTRHAFFNERSRAHNPLAAQDAWDRMLTFFSSTIGAKHE